MADDGVMTVVSAREAEVLAALGEDLSNAQIAHRLHISVRTVEGYVSSLLRRYGVEDRHALAAIAGSTPSRTTPAVPGAVTGLPPAQTTFVGRSAECGEVMAALESARLVTLVGPGGIGKTRLAAVVAQAAAPRYPFGAAFVDLVPVRHGFVAQAAASALGVAERAQQPLEEVILGRLGRGRTLLVLDNCEHLVDAVADFVNRVRTESPATSILATSRERLGLPGERVMTVGPLPLGSDAERLFVDRARSADPRFVPDDTIIADLCARLDGLPLAIELAAARSRSLGATGLLTGLGDYLRLLAGGRGPTVRHRSLRAVIGWSYELLEEEERATFRRLSMFLGEFDVAAAAAIIDVEEPVAADLLGRLVDKSLVTHQNGTTDRWRLLDTVRAFASEQLDLSGEQADVRARHLAWAADVADRLRTAVVAVAAREVDETGSPGGWQDDFDVVADDLRVALMAAPRGQDRTAHQLARALGQVSFARRFLAESLGHYREAAGRAPTPVQAAADLNSAADCAQVLNDSAEAFDLHLAAAERARVAGDGRTEAIALARAVELAGRFPVPFGKEVETERLNGLLADAGAAGDPDDPVVAARLACAKAWIAAPEMLNADQVLATRAANAARRTNDPVLLSAALDALRTAHLTAGRLRRAHRLTAERLNLLAAMNRNDPYATAEITDVLPAACSGAVAAGDLPAAMEAARLIRADDLIGYHSYLSAAQTMPALVLTGELDEVRRDAALAWDSWVRDGRPPTYWMQTAVHFAALAYGLAGDRHEFARWRDRMDEVAATPDQIRSRLAPLACFVDARVAVHFEDFAQADTLVAIAFGDHAQARYVAYAQAASAELAVIANLPDADRRIAAAAPAADENAWAAACLDRASGRLNKDAAVLTTAAANFARLDARFEHACTVDLLPGFNRPT
jgi:predicted ATPase/DNA-binding CsgD family transcriptional regulator